MNASQHTRLYFERGGARHFCAGVYLGYREGGYCVATSVMWLAVNVGLCVLDWLTGNIPGVRR